MRALAYADLQATDGHERCFTDPTKPLQIYRIDRCFKELKRIYDAYHCDALWDLGDTTDDRAAIPVPVIDTVCDHLEMFTGEWNLKLIGNHEQFVRDPKVHAGKMFRRYFTVVDKRKIFKIENVNIICVSYDDDLKAITDWLATKTMTRQPCLLLGHFQVAGAQMQSGIAATGIPRTSLNFVNIALLGHVHKPQSIGQAQYIHYIGSPFQQHWGESGEDKRVALIDLKADGAIEINWVPMVGFPAYRQVFFDEFLKAVRPDSEDRYKIILRTLAETEAYYAHPLANRADEVIYDYEQAAKAAGEPVEGALPRTRQDILRRYMDLHPPEDLGIDLDRETMLQYGDQALLEP